GIARDGGALVCVHAENDAIIAREKQALLAAGNTAPPFHAVSRPAIAEVEAVERMCRYATHMDQSVMLFHLSAAESADAVKQAKRRGAPVWAETCPHYLFMTEDVLNQPGLEGAKYMCSPPQRTVDDQEALWHAIAEGQIELVSSDHAPYRFDATGKLSAGDKPSFAEIANGLPGLETRLPLLFDEMVSKGRLGPEAFCALTASVPARRYGLQNKGSLEVGKDADIVIWNPDKRHTYGGNDLHDNVGYNPWVGRTVTGWPERVMLRGQTLLADGDFAGTPGAGQWIARPEAPTRQDFGRPGCGAP
ncbi:MAG: amidohydrolase family protein, partial [Pseudomonadota bacterium]